MVRLPAKQTTALIYPLQDDYQDKAYAGCQHLCMTRLDLLDVLRGRPEWGPAVRELRALVLQHGDEVRRREEAYGRFYAGAGP
jgi:hypothetical protein